MDPIVKCPNCGNVFNTADPRVRKLTPATFYIWEQTARRFQGGAILGPTEIARLTDVNPSTAYYHLRRLCAQGLLEKIPQRKESGTNGYRRARHLYAAKN